MNIYSIYKIENLRTNKIYIGKTNRDGFTRIRQHLSKLTTETHYNQQMQKDYDEGHISDWVFSMLETKLSRTQASIKENEYMYKYDVFEKGYNDKRISANSQIHKHQKIVEMIKAGKRYAEIRDELNVSLGTISNCKRNYIERRGF